MLYWNLRSFLQFSGLAPEIVIHDDGSIDEASARLFESKFSNLVVLRRAEADQRIAALADVPPRVMAARDGANIMALAFTDPFLLAQHSVEMVMDNDLLFFAPPREIIDFVRGHIGKQALATHFKKGTDLGVRSEYAVRHLRIEREADKLISGIVIFRPRAFTRNQFDEYFENVLDLNGHTVEQSGWASLFAQTDSGWLDERRYPVKGMPAEETVCKHFTTPRRYELYAYGIDHVRTLLS